MQYIVHPNPGNKNSSYVYGVYLHGGIINDKKY